jgi:apolipoprotein N-acyltransferase
MRASNLPWAVKKSYRLAAAGVLFSIAGLAALNMCQRTAQALLWGYRPLLLFAAFWLGLVLLLAPTFSRDARRYRWLGLSSLSALLLALGFPDTGAPFPLLMFVGFAPLLLVEKEIASAYAKAAPGVVFRHAYHTFVLWNILTTYWVANTALVAGVFAILANALLMCIPFVLFHLCRRVMPKLGYLAFIVFWLAFEYGHLNWEVTWPWLTLGNALAEFPSLVQWYEYTGVFGGSLWILLGNVLVFMAWEKYRAGAFQMADAARIAALLLVPLALSLYRYHTYEERGEKVRVVVVQPNYEPHYEKFETPESEQARRHLELTHRVIDEATEYVLFPETTFGYMATQEVLLYPAIQLSLDYLAAYPKAKLVTGLNAFHIFQPGEPLTPAARARRRADGGVYHLEVLNAAAQLKAGSDEVQWYRKSKLVPGPEIFPYRKALWFMAPLVERLDGTWEGVGTQRERSVFSSGSGKVAPVICYESVFGEYVTGYIRKGAQAIFIMTNDGWWDDTAGHRQHLRFASLRAIETRRPIARSANTGISAFINQRGDISQATRYDEPIAIKSDIAFNDATTFYVVWGDMIARIAVFTTILLLLNAAARALGGVRGKAPTRGS